MIAECLGLDPGAYASRQDDDSEVEHEWAASQVCLLLCPSEQSLCQNWRRRSVAWSKGSGVLGSFQDTGRPGSLHDYILTGPPRRIVQIPDEEKFRDVEHWRVKCPACGVDSEYAGVVRLVQVLQGCNLDHKVLEM
jgi:hypothetical protein